MVWHRLISLSCLAGVVAACSAATGADESSNPGSSGTGGAAGAANGSAASGTGSGATNAGTGSGATTGAGASTGTGSTGAPPDLGSITPTVDPNSTNCAGVVSEGEQITVDIFIMFDQSASMTCMLPAGGDRWDAVKAALQQFVTAPDAAGINVGIQYFGLGGGGGRRGGGGQSSCTPADYEKPDVEIGPLPMNSMPLVNSLNAHMPTTNTPTPAALTGAINHAIAWKNAHPGHTVVVVLVTDGEPNACGTVADVANVAAMGLMATIPTYVIGVTSPGVACDLDPNPPNQQDLDSVAQGGGTMSALLVDVTQNAGQQFVTTMNQIRAKSQVPCQYALPKVPSGQMLDPTKVNVEYTPPGAAMPATILGVTMNACDPVNGGWYYDNPSLPTKINLCPATCMAVSQQTGGKVSISVGCATKHPA